MTRQTRVMWDTKYACSVLGDSIKLRKTARVDKDTINVGNDSEGRE